MPCPAFLLLDTDVLLQLFMTSSQHILHSISKQYGMSAMVVPEVEMEVTSNRKFKRRFDAPFRKAQASGWIEVLEPRNYATTIKSIADKQGTILSVSHADIQKLGRKYNLRVDRGEAYTHAAAVLLCQAAASNDFHAITVLAQIGHILPSPVLRTFDLIVFAYQIGILAESDCNGLRQSLLANNEGVPTCWKKASFKDGLRSFVPRLVASGAKRVGKKAFAGSPNYATPLII